MTRFTRRIAAALLCACSCAAAVGGCAAPGGLAEGDPAPPVSAQPRPEALWPAWAQESARAPGAPVGRREAAPKALESAPEVGPGGLRAVDALEVARADPRMSPALGGTSITAPGRAGVRPPVYRDLTGDGQPELVVAADVATGRTALTVYTAARGKIYPVLFTIGRQIAAEAVGEDLLIRTAADDGSEQAVRYHWDGERMTVVSDERRFDKAARRCDAEERALPGRAAGDGQVCR